LAENLTACEKMWRQILEQGSPHMTI